MVGIYNYILAKECKYLCEINKIVNGVKEHRKNQKREVNIKGIKMARINKEQNWFSEG